MKTILSFYLFLYAGSCMARQPSLQSIPFTWPHSSEDVALLRLTKDTVLDTLNSIRADRAAPLYGVDAFTFKPLEQEKFYLIAGVDGSGRDLYYGLEIVYCDTSASCVFRDVYDAPPHDLANEILDIDGDGVDEIITKKLAGGYEGSQSIDVFTYSIFKLLSGRLVDVSNRYKDYYDSTLLPKMAGDAKRIRDQATQAGDLEIIDALTGLANDDYKRRILKEPSAGLQHAQAWARSGNERLEHIAIVALSDIDDPNADKLLDEMTKSEHVGTAKGAESALVIHAQKRRERRGSMTTPQVRQ